MLENFAFKGKWQARLVKIITADLTWLLLICCVFRIAYYSTLKNSQDNDSPSYLNYNGNLFKGQIDSFRTPLYPYFIKLIGFFGKDNRVNNVITVQCVVSFLSIIFFFYAARIIFKTKIAVLSSSFLFGLMMPLINFDKIIRTESLSISAIVVLIWLIAGYLRKATASKAMLLTLFLFILIMLRPSFIALVPVIVLFWIIRFFQNKNEKRACTFGLAACSAVIILMMGYSGLNKKQNGYFGLSIVSNINQLDLLISTGMYEKSNDPELANMIKIHLLDTEPLGKHWDLLKRINRQYSGERITSFITGCIKNQPGVYFKRIYDTIIDLAHENLFTNYSDYKETLLAPLMIRTEYLFFFVTFNIVYLFLGINFLSIAVSWKKTKKFPLIKGLMWLMVVAQIAVAIVGAQDEYQRLLVTIIPCLLILVFMYVDKYCGLMGKPLYTEPPFVPV